MLQGSKKAKTMTVFAITWPIFVEMLFHILMGNVDTFMLSHVSDDVVSAVGISRQLIEFTIILFNLLGLGVGVIIAQLLGAGKHKEASQVTASALTFNLVFSLAISILFIVSRDLLLSFYHIPSSIKEHAEIYMMLVGGSLFLEALMLTAGPVIRSHGFTRDTMMVGIGMNIIHVGGNALLIYGWMGLPQLGVMGAAISTIISRIIACVWIFILLYKRTEAPIKLKYYFQMKWRELTAILKIGIPSGLEWLSYQMSQMVVTRIVSFMGATAIATHVYANSIVYFFMMFGMAIGDGTEIVVARLVGSGQKEKAYHQLLRSLRWALGITIVAILSVSFFRQEIMSIFTEDASIISMGATILMFCIVLEPGRVFNHVVINSLRAAGDVKFPLMMAIISMWGIKFPLAYLLGIHFGYGLIGVWIAHACDEWVRGVFHYFRWKGRRWQNKSLLSPAALGQESVSG
ncbi:MATE family efflux transporter [Paenibacillus sp. CAA11]|uniref:MATE family efflux transporter n=1 Tax=Paenibacillus sp. CAA11 TaxID=1532905 RepID=UPI000D36F639|nr:MATE family efflux transporter [Paenibacillus sp. CAA11]AWB44497.1 MATE family efflux transporter [Paenibacillus sp. CAA11]